MESVNLFYEIGKKRTYAGAVAWYGWYDCGFDEETHVRLSDGQPGVLWSISGKSRIGCLREL